MRRFIISVFILFCIDIVAKEPLHISIVGDSISTFEDMVPEGNQVYKNYRWDSCLVDWTNTYWGRLLTEYFPDELVLEKNISVSGSCVAQDKRVGNRYRASFVTRYGKGLNTIGKPDIVIIHGGTNDRTLKMAETMETLSPREMKRIFRKSLHALDTTAFVQSYVKLIRMVHEDCPKAKILCLIGDYISTAQIDAIKSIAQHFDYVEYIDFSNGGKPNTAIKKCSGCHPDIEGMDYMAEAISRKFLELGWIVPTIYSSVKIDSASLPNPVIHDLIVSRIGERVPSPDGSLPALYVSFLQESSLSPEASRLEIKDGKATIIANGNRGFVFGAGKLLRSLTYYSNGFKAKEGSFEFKPEASFRCCYMARHHNNWYHWATADELTRYIDDMSLWGINSYRVQLSYPGVNLVGASDEDIAFFDSGSRALARRVAQLGMSLSGSGGNNVTDDNMPKEFKAIPLNPRRGNDRWNVCPSKPGATDYLIKYHMDRLRADKDKGFYYETLSFFPYDEGGCQCEDCSPWGGNGYVKLIEKLYESAREIYPEAKSVVSCWYFDEKDWTAFYEYLERQDWIDYLEIDAHGDFPQYPLEHAIPGNIPVITFPEISMWGRFPWGGYGATPLPDRFERLYRQVENIVGGFRLYSEGIYEDINKFVINGLYVDPSRHTDDLLEEYARYELPGVNVRDFKKYVHLLEETHLCGEPDSTRKADFNPARFMREYPESVLQERCKKAEEAYDIMLKLDAQILPSMRDCWRWTILKCRAIIDREMFTSRRIHTPMADECYSILSKIYHNERQIIRMEKEGLGGATCIPYLQPQLQ